MFDIIEWSQPTFQITSVSSTLRVEGFLHFENFKVDK